MAGGSVSLYSLPEYEEFDSAYQMAEAIEKLGAGLENGSREGNQSLLSQLNAWNEVVRLIGVLLGKSEILPKEQETLEGIRVELRKKIEPLAYKVRLRGIVQEHYNAAAGLPQIPIEMPAGVPRDPKDVEATVKKLTGAILLPAGATDAEKRKSVEQATLTFMSFFLTNWTNSKGKIAGKWLHPFTQQKEWLEYFISVLEGYIKFLEGVPASDYRKNAFKQLHTEARFHLLRFSKGGRRKTYKGGKGRKTRRGSKRT